MENSKTDYKLSRYNFEFPYPRKENAPEQIVMYNSRSGSIALIEAEKYAAYRAFAESGEPIADAALLADLRKGGYVVDASLDELDMLRYHLLRSRFSDSSLGLTIAPTSDCNFRCIYCYEKDSIRPVTMSEETQDDVIRFVEDRIPYISSLYINWYGGEPLLAMDIVERLSQRMMALCEEHKVEYSASIVTNGYLLTPEMMDRMNAVKISSWQVTLDGAAADHDKRRFLKGGLPTFDRIIENLVAIKDKVDGQIAIRINADRHNIERVNNVVRILKEKDLLGITHPYLAMVENYNDTYNDNSCLHTNEFSRCELDFIRDNGLDFLAKLPRQLGNYCCADSDSGFVIAADGLIYNCWNDMGIQERSMGSLKEGIRESAGRCSFLLYDATTDPECRDCKYLPICMGGCPHTRKFNPQMRCTEMKEGLAAYMEVIPTILEQRVDAAAKADAEE